ncbi:MAG TPA: hypothetical protein VHD81_10600 [Mycobacteriales bacterium]|nr:hypothetical protein [Mycobacteriales bacterium]
MRTSDSLRNRTRTTRSKWRASATVVAAATATMIGVCAAPASAATGVLASSTTLSAVITADGTGLTLTSTVAQSGSSNGLGATPTGTVTFTDSAGDKLGAVAVSGCLLKVCTVQRTVTTTQLGNLVTKITAAYSGDSVLKPSSVATAILFARCTTGTSCQGGLANATTAVGLSVPVNDSALVTLGGPQLPCSAGAGSVVNIAATGTGKAMTMQLYHLGSAATAYLAVDNSTKVANAHAFYRCDVSTVAYQAFHPATATYAKALSDFAQYGAAPTVASGTYAGLHAGLIPDCTYWFAHSATSPPVCATAGQSTPAGSDAAYLTLNAGSGVSHLVG